MIGFGSVDKAEFIGEQQHLGKFPPSTGAFLYGHSADIVTGIGQFQDRRWPLENGLIKKLQTGPVILGRFETLALDEFARLVDREGAIHQKQRLLRHGVLVSAWTMGVGAGEVESAKDCWKILSVN
jgi:hypothetical protein